MYPQEFLRCRQRCAVLIKDLLFMASGCHSKTLALCLARPLSHRYKGDGVKVAAAFPPAICSAAVTHDESSRHIMKESSTSARSLLGPAGTGYTGQGDQGRVSHRD